MPPRPKIRISWTSARPASDVDAPALRRALAVFLEGLGHGGRALSVLFAGDAALRALNLAHRGEDRPTDVLSWSYREAPEGGPGAPLGDLALSLERARAQAAKNGWALQTELLRLLAHGCAHLAGYDHRTAAQERKMRGVEEELLERIGLKGIYPKAAAGRGKGKPRARQLVAGST